MPWQETDAMEQRIEFVVRARQKQCGMSELCREYGISRKTGYKWLRRHEEVGSLSQLKERSRRPHGRSPWATPQELEEKVVALRQLHGWGARKIHLLLEREGIVDVPVVTISRILKRRGLVTLSRPSRSAQLRFERQAPNELWQMDFKGDFAVPGGRCYPLSVLDDHSRYAVGLYSLGGQKHESVQSCLVDCMERYGVPEAMLMDHGAPWWSTTNGHGLTRLSVFLIQQGVHLIYSSVGHPQTQGKVERFHRTLNDSLRHRGLPRTLEGFTQALKDFRQEYNHVRPHEALAMAVPVDRYRPSQRRYSTNPPQWDYAEGSDVRRLNSSGCLYYRGTNYFVCEALAAQTVLCQDFDGRLLVTYRHMHVREIELSTGRTYALIRPVDSTQV